jgi:hypothetical protein
MSEQFSTPQQALVERLRRAPQPELSSDARAMIRARVLDALDHPPLPAPRPIIFHPLVAVIVVLVAGALVAGGVLLALSRQNQTTVIPTITIEPSATTLPTRTSPAVISSPIPSQTPTLTTTSTVTLSPTSLPTLAATISPTPLPTTTVSTITVIEGPVEKIDGNIITIYGTQVQVPSNDPILSNLKVGDVLHIEGDSEVGTTQIVIVATTIEVTNGDVNVNPSSGEVWHDDGTCLHPPPDWALADGWRRRCQTNSDNSNNNNNNQGNDDKHNNKPDKPNKDG